MRRLLDVLREDLGLTGTKEGCGEGECGACTVLVDGEVVVSCLVPVCQVDGSVVRTVEGLAAAGGQPGALGDLQDAFLVAGGAQCGICTPGMLMAARGVPRERRRADRRRDPRGDRRQPLPLHGLHEDRGLDPARRASPPRRGGLRPRCPSNRRSSRPARSRRRTPSSPARRTGPSPAARTCSSSSPARSGRRPSASSTCGASTSCAASRVRRGALEIGALTTYTQIRRSEACATHAPALVAAAATIGAAQIQNRGTIGGNVMNASPAGDTLPVLLALDAVLVVGGPDGERDDPGGRVLARVPADRASARASCSSACGSRSSRAGGRRSARSARDAPRRSRRSCSPPRGGATPAWRDVRIAFGSVAATPIRASAAEAALEGAPATAAAIEAPWPPCWASCTPSTTCDRRPPTGSRSRAGSSGACWRRRNERARREPLRQGRRSAWSRSTRAASSTRCAT